MDEIADDIRSGKPEEQMEKMIDVSGLIRQQTDNRILVCSEILDDSIPYLPSEKNYHK
jgi:hypothetical protein